MSQWVDEKKRVARYQVFIEPVSDTLDEDLREYMLRNIERIATEDSALLEKASNAKITFHDPELRIVSRLSLFRSARVRIMGGWTAPDHIWFEGIINNFEPVFGRTVLVSLLCADATTLLQNTAERIEENVTDSEMVTMILEEYGLTPKVEDTELKYPSLTKPQGVRDIDFIIELAKRNEGFTFYINPETGEAFFGKRPLEQTQGDPLVLAYGIPPFNLKEFQPSFQNITTPGIAASDIDLENGETMSERAGADGVGAVGKKPFAVDLGVFTERTPDFWEKKSIVREGSAEPVQNREHLLKMLQAKAAEESFNVTGTGEVNPPEPAFRANRLVVITGIGDELSGTWYVSAVRNTIDRKGGWVQQFDVQKNAPAYIAADRSLVEQAEAEAERRRKLAVREDSERWWKEKEVTR